MKPFDNQFSDRVRQAFDNHEEAFDEKAWSAMQARLNQQQPARVIPLARSLAAVAAVVLLGVLSFHIFFMSKPDMDEPVRISSMPALISPLPAIVEYDLLVYNPAPRPVAPGRFSERDAVVETNEEDLPVGDLHVAAARLVADTAETTMPSPHIAEFSIVLHEDVTEVLLPLHLPSRQSGGFAWGVTAGPVLTWAENQLASGVGYGVGVVADYRISDRLSLSSGLLLAHRQFELDNVLVNEFSAVDHMNPQTFYEVFVIGDYQIEHLTLDIPVNIRVKLFNRPGSRLSLMAGFSSLVYLHQDFSGTHRSHASTYQNSHGSIQRISTDVISLSAEMPTGKNYDLAGLINFSLGYELPIGQQVLFLEPFIQYPLGDLSPHSLRMGMGGLKLRVVLSGQ